MASASASASAEPHRIQFVVFGRLPIDFSSEILKSGFNDKEQGIHYPVSFSIFGVSFMIRDCSPNCTRRVITTSMDDRRVCMSCHKSRGETARTFRFNTFIDKESQWHVSCARGHHNLISKEFLHGELAQKIDIKCFCGSLLTTVQPIVVGNRLLSKFENAVVQDQGHGKSHGQGQGQMPTVWSEYTEYVPDHVAISIPSEISTPVHPQKAYYNAY